MAKKILILAGSARKAGNTSRLCDAFIRGAQESGCETEKIFIKDMDISGCLGCGACQRNGGSCVQRDDKTGIIEKILASDSVVIASPVYYYTWNAQTKTVLDRTYALHGRSKDKVFYLLSAGAAPSEDYQEHMKQSFELYVRCYAEDNCTAGGMVFGIGANGPSDVEGTEAIQSAYELGKQV